MEMTSKQCGAMLLVFCMGFPGRVDSITARQWPSCRVSHLKQEAFCGQALSGRSIVIHPNAWGVRRHFPFLSMLLYFSMPRMVPDGPENLSDALPEVLRQDTQGFSREALLDAFAALPGHLKSAFTNQIVLDALRVRGRRDVGVHWVADDRLEAAKQTLTLPFNRFRSLWYFIFPRDGRFQIEFEYGTHLVLIDLDAPRSLSMNARDRNRMGPFLSGKPGDIAFGKDEWLYPQIIDTALTPDEKARVFDEYGKDYALWTFFIALKVRDALLFGTSKAPESIDGTSTPSARPLRSAA